MLCLWTHFTPDIITLIIYLHTNDSFMLQYMIKFNTVSSLCCYKQGSKHTVADKYERTSSKFKTILICCNSSHKVRRHNHVPQPSCQSQCSPTLFMALFFIYEYIFPCHLKVRKRWFAGRNRAAKAFRRGRAAFISHTGWESCGMWGSYSADKPNHLYIAGIM